MVEENRQSKDDGAVSAQGAQPQINFEGANKARSDATSSRIWFSAFAFFLCFCAISTRLVLLGFAANTEEPYRPGHDSIAAARPDILDRNGEILATDVKTASLAVDPQKVIDVDEAIDGLLSIFPDLDEEQLQKALSGSGRFAWIKRKITPKQQQAVLEAGIPGLSFRSEFKRFYPAGATTSHIIGVANIDNVGVSGMEKYVDESGLSVLRKMGMSGTRDQKPLALSIDLRVQHVLREELFRSKTKFKALAAAGVVLNIYTGEVLGMASLPDFDPNNQVDMNKPDRLNRVTAGLYEMGSVFKSITMAMAFDSGKVTLQDSFDARTPIRARGGTISDFHAKKRILTVPEIFIYSSNIGTAKMAMKVGKEDHKKFLKRVHLLDRLKTELPETRTPYYPSNWTDLSTMTISFGHGLSVTPLQFAATAAALVNGGYYIKPTFLPRSREDSIKVEERILSEKTSASMRYLMWLNADKGSGKRSRVDGYMVGGKTGTAEKVVNKVYSKDKVFNSFLSAFPIDDPQYLVLVMLDEPQGLPETYGYTTAGMNTAPTAGSVIRRIGPILGVLPRFGQKVAPTIEASF